MSTETNLNSNNPNFTDPLNFKAADIYNKEGRAAFRNEVLKTMKGITVKNALQRYGRGDVVF